MSVLCKYFKKWSRCKKCVKNVEKCLKKAEPVPAIAYYSRQKTIINNIKPMKLSTVERERERACVCTCACVRQSHETEIIMARF